MKIIHLNIINLIECEYSIYIIDSIHSFYSIDQILNTFGN